MLGAKCLGNFGKKRYQVERRTMDPSMYKAAISGDVGFLHAIGEASTDILSQKTPNGNNILHLAAEFKQLSFFRDVPSSVGGGLFWDINNMGDTPLHIAAKAGSVELVDFLINQAKMLHFQRAGDQERGPTYAKSYKKLLRKTNLKKRTALHVAVQYGHHGVVMSLMKADPKLCCSTNRAVESPLFLATCKGFSKIAAAILEEPSVSPSFQGINGVTALHAAVSHTYQGAEGIVKSMVSKCPDMIRKADALGWTPLHYAAFRGNLKAVTVLMESDKSQKKDKSGTSYILDKHGMTALHVAAYKGHIEVMKELIQYQPDTCEILNAKDQTILHVAVLGAQSDVVKYILQLPELPRLIDQVDEEGYTPLQLAVMGQNDEITRMLTLDCGVDNTSSIDKGFSLVFDNFLGEDNKTQVQEEHKMKEQEMSTQSSHQARSFGVPAFQEQISRDFKKFESNPGNKDSGASAISSNTTESVKSINLLIATLIATVTFTAALAPPGGFGDDGKAILQDNTSFRWFQQFNLLSFVFSIMVLVYESITAYIGSIISKERFPFKPGSLMMVSLYGLLLAFLTGLTATLDKKRKSNSADAPIGAVSVVFVLVAMIPHLYETHMAQLRKTLEKRFHGALSLSK